MLSVFAIVIEAVQLVEFLGDLRPDLPLLRPKAQIREELFLLPIEHPLVIGINEALHGGVRLGDGEGLVEANIPNLNQLLQEHVLLGEVLLLAIDPVKDLVSNVVPDPGGFVEAHSQLLQLVPR